MGSIIAVRAHEIVKPIYKYENSITTDSSGELTLSDLEFDVLQEYLDGKSYQKIAESLDKHVKSVDNALQRVKRKLEVFLEKHNI